MLEIHDRARLLQVAIDRSLADVGLRSTSSNDLISVLVEILTTSDRVGLFRSYIDQAKQNPLKLAVRNAIASEMMANRLSRFSDCLSIILAEYAAESPSLRKRFESSDLPQLQRIAKIVSGDVIIDDRVTVTPVILETIPPVAKCRVKPKPPIATRHVKAKPPEQPPAPPIDPDSIDEVIIDRFSELKKRTPRRQRFRSCYEISSTAFVRRTIRQVPRKNIDDEWMHCEFRFWPLPRLTRVQKKFLKRATDYVKAHMESEQISRHRLTPMRLALEAEMLWKRTRFREHKAETVNPNRLSKQSDEISALILRRLAQSTRNRIYD